MFSVNYPMSPAVYSKTKPTVSTTLYFHGQVLHLELNSFNPHLNAANLHVSYLELRLV